MSWRAVCAGRTTRHRHDMTSMNITADTLAAQFVVLAGDHDRLDDAGPVLAGWLVRFLAGPRSLADDSGVPRRPGRVDGGGQVVRARSMTSLSGIAAPVVW